MSQKLWEIGTLFLITMLTCPNYLRAQRKLDFFDPDFDSSYAVHHAMYDLLIREGVFHWHYYAFFSNTAKSKKLKKTSYTHDGIKHFFNSGGFLDSSIQITKWPNRSPTIAKNYYSYSNNHKKISVRFTECSTCYTNSAEYYYNDHLTIDSIYWRNIAFEERIYFNYDAQGRIARFRITNPKGEILISNEISYSKVACSKAFNYEGHDASDQPMHEFPENNYEVYNRATNPQRLISAFVSGNSKPDDSVLIMTTDETQNTVYFCTNKIFDKTTKLVMGDAVSRNCEFFSWDNRSLVFAAIHHDEICRERFDSSKSTFFLNDKSRNDFLYSYSFKKGEDIIQKFFSALLSLGCYGLHSSQEIQTHANSVHHEVKFKNSECIINSRLID